MSRHRNVSTKMWTDEKFRALSAPRPNAQTLWLFLLTGPHTNIIPGLFGVGERALAEALNWPLPGFRRAFREIERLGMVRADWTARLVFIPNAMRHNPPANPNVVKAWSSALEELPECALKTAAAHCLLTFLEGLGESFAKPFAKPFREALGKSLPIQEQDQDQDQEQDQDRESASALPPAPDPEVKLKKRKPESALPGDLTLTLELRTYAADHGLEPEREFEAFKLHALEKDRRLRDWPAGFRRWCLKSEEFRRNGKASSPAPRTRSLQQALREADR